MVCCVALRRIPTHEQVVTVACGGLSSAALTESGRVFTWGCSDDGALGRSTDDNNPEHVPAEVRRHHARMYTRFRLHSPQRCYSYATSPVDVSKRRYLAIRALVRHT